MNIFIILLAIGLGITQISVAIWDNDSPRILFLIIGTIVLIMSGIALGITHFGHLNEQKEPQYQEKILYRKQDDGTMIPDTTYVLKK
jgi:hypothetical protein